ncbi:MAG TPA: CPBP family intramembrane glutamic endopeptidase, partial [Ohtaekwangia sp.]|uniref:CPBP family intramembrane glutamic endopeptidase n=1 Tax=Ohtaekwangia sp. TaxID=2066019 RepID=UPI002F92ABE4
VEHVTHDFNVGHYSAVAIFLAASLYSNYTLDFENGVLDNLSGIYKFTAYLLTYAVAYFAVLLSVSIFKKEKSFWRSKWFWMKSVLMLLALSADSSVPFLRPIVNELTNSHLELWVFKLTINLVSGVLVLLPLLLFYYIVERNDRHAYGLGIRPTDMRPYFVMLALMLPVIILASFHPSFLKQYPMYRGGAEAAAYLGIPEWTTVIAYELAYAFDFVTLEFLFRGFMVIGLLQYTGRNSVLAMVAIYCFLHFGKPPGEAISSIFGGYILGVIAYETKSIWGGIAVHIGIAWSMELTAFIQHQMMR